MVGEPIVKTEGGVDKLVLLGGYLANDLEACHCCTNCCQDILGGTFNLDGNLVYETDVLTIVLEPPTPNSRTVCDGDLVTMTATLKSPYNSGSTFFWHLWLDRDWLHQSHSATTELHEGAHWYIWETETPTAAVVIKWTECWVNYAQQYGDIRFGTKIGDPTEEFVDIFCQEHELDPGVDCCVYFYECVDCEFLFPTIGDPVGPEETSEGVTYWFDDADADDWAMKIIATGPDPATKTMARGEAIALDVGIRPPKDQYLNHSTLSEVCFQYPGWKDAMGTQHHPAYPSLDDALPATACYPSSFSDDTGDCPQLVRFQYQTPALLFNFGATIAECFEDACADLQEPGTLTVNAIVTSEDPDVDVTGAITPEPCTEDLNECCTACCSYTGDESVTGLYGTYNDIEMVQNGLASLAAGATGKCNTPESTDNIQFEVPVTLSDQLGEVSSYDTIATIQLIEPDPIHGCRWLVTIPQDAAMRFELAHSGWFIASAHCIGLQDANTPAGDPNGWGFAEFMINDPDGSAEFDSCQEIMPGES